MAYARRGVIAWTTPSQFWRQRQAELAFCWGTYAAASASAAVQEEERASFCGVEAVDPVRANEPSPDLAPTSPRPRPDLAPTSP